MRRIAAVVLGTCLALAACADGDERVGAGPAATDAATPVTEPAEPTAPDLDRPPEVVVRSGDDELSLAPWTTCWGGGGAGYCADGMPPGDLELLTGDELVVEFPVEGWEFHATRRPPPGECGRSQTVPLEPIGDTTHRLDPIGRAGEDDVDVFGRGPGGDVIVTFRWRTTVDGTMPTPTASLSLLADHDGRVDSYGVELPVTGLAATPAEATATVTVTAADGAAHVLELAEQDRGTCLDGDLFLSAPLEEGLAAAALGERPFTYDVVLHLDGADHRARARWPDDEDPECAPCVPLTFDPPLPAPAPSGFGAG